MKQKTRAEALSIAGTALRQLKLDQRIAMILLSRVIKQPITKIWTHPERTITNHEYAGFQKLMKRWLNGEPLGYLLGEWEFFGLKFFVDDSVLVPRPETELMVEQAIDLVPRNAHLVDLGTGSGCLAVTMAVKRRDLHIQAFDPSADALRMARRNVARHKVGSRVSLHKGTITALARHPLRKPWVLLANLPYLTSEEASEASLRPEPRLALDGGTDGLEIFRPTLAVLQTLPLPPMLSLWEIDPRRVQQTRALIRAALPNQRTEILRDLAGRARVIRAF